MHVQAIGTGVILLVAVAQLVPGVIGAVLLKLDGESAKRRAVDPGEKDIHNPLRHDLDPAKASYLGGIQEIDSLHVCHASRKLMNSGMSRVEDSRGRVIRGNRRSNLKPHYHLWP